MQNYKCIYQKCNKLHQHFSPVFVDSSNKTFLLSSSFTCNTLQCCEVDRSNLRGESNSTKLPQSQLSSSKNTLLFSSNSKLPVFVNLQDSSSATKLRATTLSGDGFINLPNLQLLFNNYSLIFVINLSITPTLKLPMSVTCCLNRFLTGVFLLFLCFFCTGLFKGDGVLLNTKTVFVGVLFPIFAPSFIF